MKSLKELLGNFGLARAVIGVTMNQFQGDYVMA